MKARGGEIWLAQSAYRHTLFYYALRYCTSQITVVFYKLKVCGKAASSKYFDAIFPTVFINFMSLCHTLVILTIF